MARPLRHFEPGKLYEITTPTLQRRYLLRPDPVINALIAGVIGRAQRIHEMCIHGLAVLSNHEHLLVTPSSPQQLADFMDYLNGNVAREVARHTGWRGKVWEHRYVAIRVSDEEAAQVGRLRYLLAQGVKEGLVERPQDWPGIHCAQSLLDGGRITGIWVDRTAACRARLAGSAGAKRNFEETETITFTPIPCWADASAEDYRARVRELVDAIVDDTRLARRYRAVLGREKILRQRPTDSPDVVDRSAAPPVHAATQVVRIALRAAFREFVASFRAAADRLRRSELDVVFPAGAFPPPFPRPAPA